MLSAKRVGETSTLASALRAFEPRGEMSVCGLNGRKSGLKGPYAVQTVGEGLGSSQVKRPLVDVFGVELVALNGYYSGRIAELSLDS